MIFDGDWKLIEHLDDGKIELFNLRDDPFETSDVATETTDKTKELLAKLSRWRERINAQMPRPNPAYTARL